MKDMRGQPVDEGYRGIMKIIDSERIQPDCLGAFVELANGEHIVGVPSHRVKCWLYKNLIDLRNRKNPIRGKAINCSERNLMKYARKKNNYW